MWFNEKNAIKKLARNLHNDVKKMNVITIETVKHYGDFFSREIEILLPPCGCGPPGTGCWIIPGCGPPGYPGCCGIGAFEEGGGPPPGAGGPLKFGGPLCCGGWENDLSSMWFGGVWT